ncbi:MAG: rod shape-determining protein MreC [Proteobacteria bacterium]|jgi:rod shape-determining protein MreC|nr:rod shape-determining protein MreC [Pseudomonadota bacterium]
MNQLHYREQGTSIRTLFLVGLCIALMFVDQRFNHLEVVRSNISLVLSPIRYLVSLPAITGSWANEWLSSHIELLNENSALKAKGRILNARLQKMQVLKAENTRLRNMLGSSRKLADQVIVAELLSVDQNPYRQLIEINKGTFDGVELGLAVIDDFGVMGQVIHVNQYTATTILISDPEHAIPVQFIRSGTRSVAFGNGSVDQLELRYLPATADIKVNDQLVTSGLGGRFPADYPVATVISITKDLTHGFVSVLAKPLARLDSSREVLVVKSNNGLAAE